MKSRMRLAWWREVSVRGGRAGWLLANRLQCNLHSYGWISNVGVLYKGIWLPAELHDMQLAHWRVATNTIVCNHTDMDVCTDTQRHSVWFICWIIKNIQISDTLRHTLHSWHAVQVPCLPYLALCLPRVPVNQRALALPLATQLWYLPKTSLIIAFNPANAPGGWGQTRVCFREDGMRLETRVTPSAQLCRHTNISVVVQLLMLTCTVY